MDARRFVILAGAALCALSPATGAWALGAGEPSPADDEARPYLEVVAMPPARIGRRAITAANREARAPSRSDRFEGGVQVFAWAPGRVYEVWTAPLRVTTLSLAPGERLIAKAAGDTVRWQIGEVRSGDATSGQTLILLKPLQRGLETNLVLSTDRRVYHLQIRSGGADAFNAAVAWNTPEPVPVSPEPVETADETVASHPPPLTPVGPLNARYRIETSGRRPQWTPTAVFDDGRQTFLAFPPELQTAESPALFVIAADGETQFVNYRQTDGLIVVDRLFDRAELRLGDRRPQIVRIRRLDGGRP